MQIREIRPEELISAGDVALTAFRALSGTPLSAGYARELADTARRAQHARVLVAVEDGRVLGTVTYIDDASSPYAERLGVGEAGIRMLAVDPDSQGRGAGAALVAWCVDRARADPGIRLLALHTTPWMTASHRIYERAGFRRAPERDWSPLPDVPLLGFVLDVAGTVDPRPGGGTRKTRGA